MKSLINICIGFMAMAYLSSCENETPITDYRGQVKFETISVSNKLAGRISKIYVQEGQTVKQGDTLAIIYIPEVNAKMMQTEGAITAAKGQLNMALKGATLEQLGQIDGQIDAAKAQLNFAQESYNRLQAMYKDSLISLQSFDEVKMKRDMAKAQISALQAKRKEVSQSARTEQIDQAKGQLNRALGAKEEVLSAADEKVMTAPVDMTIETISLQEGELLTPGYALFNGYQKNSMFFRFTIPESKIYDFKVDQELTLINPYIEQETSAKIIAIKQLAHYADITSTSPLYELSESIYELKVIPTSDVSKQSFFLNATVLIK
ncbi:HlyD family secretion protein [Arcticibacterium luteifluviistationis]|uniref:Biotin attachment protein n=1 Tax=Arcticibacterium luteifluviistationis TaxID=1784714 RepID=A0A2Z4G7N1_9BACT|nr:efflux RND transporter periplasmic adaptor subunit [Arcticibacterium luteifluviistationis]AWV97110.1 biotin attachment protein [Arcticibacterium luteifluviistationis]